VWPHPVHIYKSWSDGVSDSDGWMNTPGKMRKEIAMDISVSEEVYEQLEQVKEWMESKIGREVTFDEVLVEVLKNFQMVLHPEDLGSA
jgi:hypothetical protein